MNYDNVVANLHGSDAVIHFGSNLGRSQSAQAPSKLIASQTAPLEASELFNLSA